MSTAPKRGLENGKLLPFYEEQPDGRRRYRQIDDELLGAFEADCALGGPAMASSMGMMIARIRAAESDRAALLAALEKITAAAEAPPPPSTRVRPTHEADGRAPGASICSKHGLGYGSCAACDDDEQRDADDRYIQKQAAIRQAIDDAAPAMAKARGP